MLTTRQLDECALKLLNHANDFFHKDVSDVVSFIEAEFYKEIIRFSENEKQQLYQIENEFIEPYQLDSDDDDDDDDMDVDEQDSLQAQESNLYGHTVICYSRITLLKLLIARANNNEGQLKNIPKDVFYNTVMQMFAQFSNPTFYFPSYMASLNKKYFPLRLNALPIEYLILFDTGIINMAIMSTKTNTTTTSQATTSALNLKFLFSGLIKKANLGAKQIDLLVQELFWPEKIENEIELQMKNNATISKIEDQFKRYLNTDALSEYERHAIKEIERRFWKYLSTNLPFLSPLENQLDSQFILTCARVGLIKLIIARDNKQAGMFENVSYVFFYGALLGLFDKQHRDKPMFDSCTYLTIINRSNIKPNLYTLEQFNQIHIMILQDAGFITRVPKQDVDRLEVLKIRYLFNINPSANTSEPLITSQSLAPPDANGRTHMKDQAVPSSSSTHLSNFVN